MRSRGTLALVAFWLVSGVARAGVENPFVTPLGEREIATANAGVAGLRPSAGAVLFNPANLELMENSSISVSGSAYVFSTLAIDPFINVDGTNLPYNATGFDTIPSSVVSVWKRGPWSLAFSLLVPEAQRSENRLTLPTPNTRTTVVQLQSAQELWAGPSVSRSIGDDFALGLSLFAVRSSSSMLIGTYTTFPGLPNVAATTQTHLTSDVYSLTALAGARWRATSFLDVGLRVRMPGLLLTGSGDGYAFQQTLDNGGTVSEIEQKGVPARTAIPFDVSLGTGWTVSSAVRVLADLSVQAGVTFDGYPGSVFSDRQRFTTRPRASVALEVDVTDTIELATGIQWNPSTRDDADLDEGEGKQDILLVTVGGAYRMDRVRSGFSVFHGWSNAGFKAFNVPDGTARMRSRVYGASLVFSYALGDAAASATPPTSSPAPVL